VGVVFSLFQCDQQAAAGELLQQPLSVSYPRAGDQDAVVGTEIRGVLRPVLLAQDEMASPSLLNRLCAKREMDGLISMVTTWAASLLSNAAT
jgi:hypothetical protein